VTQKGDFDLIVALASGATVEDAARAGGVSRATVYRRLEDADFKRQIADARSEMLARAVGTLADASTAAAATLRALLEADSESVRLGASRSILELGTKLRESEELAQRIAALEAQLAGQSANGRGFR
jgi:hypothetical protein